MWNSHFLEALFASLHEGKGRGKIDHPRGREKHAYFFKKDFLLEDRIPAGQLVRGIIRQLAASKAGLTFPGGNLLQGNSSIYQKRTLSFARAGVAKTGQRRRAQDPVP